MDMRKVGLGFITCVIVLSSHLVHLQPLLNESDVHFSQVTNFSLLVSNSTATPEAFTFRTPDTVSQCYENNAIFSCRNKCKDGSTQWKDKVDKEGKSAAHCHCDQACLTYNDCCADYTHYCQPNSSVPQGIGRTNFICSKISTDVSSIGGVFMVSTCAESWKDEDVRSKCLAGSKNRNRTFTSVNILEEIPVAQFLKPGIHYRNIYCGICNKEATLLLLFWDLKFRCTIKPPPDLNDTQTLNYMLKYCPTRIVLPSKNFQIRTCSPMVSSCSIQKPTEHKIGCLMGASGIIHYIKTKTNYKNYHCVLCNGLSMKGTKCGPQDGGFFFKPKSFEIVMQFHPSPQIKLETKLSEVNMACPDDKVYDPHLETCRTGYVPNPSNAIRDKYRVKIWMYPSDGHMRPVTHDQLRIAFFQRFALDPSQIDEISITSEDNFKAAAFNLYAGASSRKNDEKKNMQYKNNFDVSDLLNFSKSFEINFNNKTWEVIRVTNRQLACVESIEFSRGEFKLLPTGEAIINKTGQTLSLNRFFLVNQGQMNESVFVCKSKFTVQCLFVLLPIESDEYIIFQNKTLLHTTTGRAYTTGEYDLDGQKAMVCTNYTKVNYTNTSIQIIEPKITVKAESDFLRYLTVAGLSASMFALIITLVIHFIFPELRTPLPGKNLMNLCVALVLSQFMWLFGTGYTDKPTFCTAVAAVIHYLFLVSFACMAVIAFDTRRTFSSQITRAPGRSIGGHDKNLRFLTYICVAWGFPMFFVCGCFLLDHFQVVSIGYGNQDACWLVSGDGKIVAFGVPIASFLLYNIAAFSHTVWAINRARKQTTRVKSGRQDQKIVLKIYLRLVTLMGFTWFFSFTAELIHKALIYPFVVLTTTQGVYIFVAFVCKTRVLKLMKDSFARSRKDILVSTRQTASTDSRSLPPYSQYRSETEDTHM